MVRGDIDHEIEEQLTEQLVDLYKLWKSCNLGVGTEDDKRDAFFHAIRGRLEKGFSILTKPGMYEEEKEMEKILGKLYRTWRDYMNGCISNDTAINIFIESTKGILDITIIKEICPGKV
jgi:hypothetical protein